MRGWTFTKTTGVESLDLVTPYPSPAPDKPPSCPPWIEDVGRAVYLGASWVAYWRGAGRFCGGGLVDGSLRLRTGGEVIRCLCGLLVGSGGGGGDSGDGVLDGRLRFLVKGRSSEFLCDSFDGIVGCYW